MEAVAQKFPLAPGGFVLEIPDFLQKTEQVDSLWYYYEGYKWYCTLFTFCGERESIEATFFTQNRQVNVNPYGGSQKASVSIYLCCKQFNATVSWPCHTELSISISMATDTYTLSM